MLYAAKCYWPGVTRPEVERITADVRGPAERGGAAYMGSLVFEDDDLVLCLFEARSAAAVKRASERVGIPCERVMEPVWLRGAFSSKEANCGA